MLDESLIASLKAKHGTDLVSAVDNGVAYVFRKPRKHEWARFVESVSNNDRKTTKAVAFARLCQDCFVYPEAEGKPDIAALNSFFEDRPGAPANIAGDLSDLAGAGDGLEVGKL